MAANKRLYYAIKQVGLKPAGDNAYTPIYGLQDASIGTNFNLSQIFEMGQLAIYQQIEELPDVEVSMNKVFDGRPLIWHLATKDATSPTLAGRSNSRASMAMSLFSDTADSAAGAPETVIECSGLYPQNISYNFGVDGAFTESVSFIGNDKISSADNKILNTAAIARRDALTSLNGVTGVFTTNADKPVAIERRENLNFDTTVTSLDINGTVADKDCTILPYDVDGITPSGTNPVVAGQRVAHIQSINISTDLGREALNELGRRAPYHRYATFPVEVTCAIEALSLSGDNISATEDGIYTTGTACTDLGGNLKDRTIRLATDCGVRIYLGTQNRLSSVDFGGGSTDGGNDTNTYNFTNFNELTVMAQYDPHSSSATWWTNRADYLVDTP